MFGLGMPELIVILIIALVIFGTNRLPQLGEGLGKAIRGFKKGISDSPDQIGKDADKKDNKNNNVGKG
jgi:sec-independent protein translocase protein TatA